MQIRRILAPQLLATYHPTKAIMGAHTTSCGPSVVIFAPANRLALLVGRWALCPRVCRGHSGAAVLCDTASIPALLDAHGAWAVALEFNSFPGSAPGARASSRWASRTASIRKARRTKWASLPALWRAAKGISSSKSSFSKLHLWDN